MFLFRSQLLINRMVFARRGDTSDAARQIVLDSLDTTPDDAWKPHDAKARDRALLLRAVRELETMPLPHPASHGNGNGGRKNGGATG